jgi:ArsR family transcriptional regulator, arsenate/arsenite/antimonite-responsive transcriptional repressor
VETSTEVRGLSRDEARLAQMLKALGNPVRFRIMQYLTEQNVCITGDIVDYFHLAQSTISQHLKVLREAGLISGEIEGPATCYCINPEGVLWLKERIENWLPDCCRNVADKSAGSSLSGDLPGSSSGSCC